jgi:hypothetical protein
MSCIPLHVVKPSAFIRVRISMPRYVYAAPSKMEGEGDQPVRTLPAYLVWDTGGVTLGYDENGLFEPYTGEGNVERTRRRTKSDEALC